VVEHLPRTHKVLFKGLSLSHSLGKKRKYRDEQLTRNTKIRFLKLLPRLKCSDYSQANPRLFLLTADTKTALTHYSPKFLGISNPPASAP
jgi:hypothetical protein